VREGNLNVPGGSSTSSQRVGLIPAHFKDVIQFETPWLAVVCATGTAAAITEDTQNTE
jgi:hypothetical protein